MNIYIREMKANSKSLIFWSLGILALIAASMMKYAATSVVDIDTIMGQLPLALQAMFGVGYLDFAKASGFYAVIYQYLMLMAAIHASMLGAVIISKEERDRTSEFLYVKPVARREVITSKIGAAVTCVVVLNAITTITSLMFINIYGKGENVAGGVVLLMIGMLLVQFVFLFMGMAAAAALKRPKASTGIAAGVMLAAYFLSVAIDVSGKINYLIGFTPFKYFDAKYLLYGGSIEIWYVLLSVALAAGFIAATYWFFKRRDLRV